jgi:hypothetical protein
MNEPLALNTIDQSILLSPTAILAARTGLFDLPLSWRAFDSTLEPSTDS